MVPFFLVPSRALKIGTVEQATCFFSWILPQQPLTRRPEQKPRAQRPLPATAPLETYCRAGRRPYKLKDVAQSILKEGSAVGTGNPSSYRCMFEQGRIESKDQFGHANFGSGYRSSGRRCRVVSLGISRRIGASSRIHPHFPGRPADCRCDAFGGVWRLSPATIPWPYP